MDRCNYRVFFIAPGTRRRGLSEPFWTRSLVPRGAEFANEPTASDRLLERNRLEENRLYTERAGNVVGELRKRTHRGRFAELENHLGRALFRQNDVLGLPSLLGLAYLRSGGYSQRKRV